MTSVLSPGDKVLVPICGRFALLLVEIAQRCQAEVVTIETPWGTVFAPEQIEAALEQHRPKLLALVHRDTSTTMAPASWPRLVRCAGATTPWCTWTQPPQSPGWS
ncbi:MAG: (S)-ureidoglycine-glyoxylate aminotransferase [Gammaproteobacteria bacterium]|jgi:(S)-ureidoglycine-glyoxylate aminotransferase